MHNSGMTFNIEPHKRLNSYPSNQTRGSSLKIIAPTSMQVGFTVHNESTLSFADRQPGKYYLATNQSLGAT
jgi:hypothetical protein